MVMLMDLVDVPVGGQMRVLAFTVLPQTTLLRELLVTGSAEVSSMFDKKVLLQAFRGPKRSIAPGTTAWHGSEKGEYLASAEDAESNACVIVNMQCPPTGVRVSTENFKSV